MSRRFPRIRVRLTATVRIEGSSRVVVCPTRDLSAGGCFLDTAEPVELGANLEIALLDVERGEVIETIGRVTRTTEHGLGVEVSEPPEEWSTLVERLQMQTGATDARGVRLRVLVVGDGTRRRGALALYVTSGWDIRFASDVASATEALEEVDVDAVIAECALSSDAFTDVLTKARALRPRARRIVRCTLGSEPAPDPRNYDGLIDRVVDSAAGMDALLDALTADLGESATSDGARTAAGDDRLG